MELWREIVMSGHWTCAGSVAQPVRLLRQDFDPNHEPDLDEGPPTLDAAGVSYTIAFGRLRGMVVREAGGSASVAKPARSRLERRIVPG